MTPLFAVKTSPHFERLYKRLVKRHPSIPKLLREAIAILETDPFNRSNRYVIKKLIGPQQDGQYRLSLGRWRFRYDIVSQTVELNSRVTANLVLASLALAAAKTRFSSISAKIEYATGVTTSVSSKHRLWPPMIVTAIAER